MHKILVLSIQHTGTYFASATISAAFAKKRQLRIGSLYERHQKLGHERFIDTNPIELSDFIRPGKIDSTWIDQAITTACTPDEIANKKIIVGHEHHHKPGSWVIESLKEEKPEAKIIIPVRDPLLSLHSKLWREDEQHHNPNEMDSKARNNRLTRWIKLYTDILSIPEDHVFFLPIDGEQSKTEEGRVKLVEDMYNFCEIHFNERAQEAATAWTPDNKTFDLIKKTQKNSPKPKWENFKKRYEAGDIEHTKAFMDLEFTHLKEESELKELLSKVGYKELLWW